MLDLTVGMKRGSKKISHQQMIIAPLPQRTSKNNRLKTMDSCWHEKNPGHVSKDRGIVGRFKYVGGEGGMQVILAIGGTK